MRYTYAYKTSDGIRHEAVIEAASRAVAFAELRKQGIKAIKVIAADGSKENGEVRGVRIRGVIVIALSVALIAGVASFWLGRGRSRNQPDLFQDRHQVYGDPATIQKIESGSIPIARNDIEKFLLAYAIPGRPITLKSAPARIDISQLALTPLNPQDRPEVTSYKQILNGLKVESKAYLEGGGTWRTFVSELNNRQQREIEIYERTRRELESITDPTTRDKYNTSLRELGLRTIPNPKEEE